MKEQMLKAIARHPDDYMAYRDYLDLIGNDIEDLGSKGLSIHAEPHKANSAIRKQITTQMVEASKTGMV